MPSKSKTETVAVIDIASNELRLKVAEKGKNDVRYLESLHYPLSLGRDTFNTGKISFDKVDKVCDIIKNFLVVAKGYGINNIKAIATTAVREATNSAYILDQIKIKTGVDVRVMDDSDEKIYIYKLVARLCSEEQKQSGLMVHIGSGNIGISVFEDGYIPFMENIKLGTLRINEIFDGVQDHVSEFHAVVEDYIRSFTDMLQNEVPSDIKNFIVSGSDSEVIAKLCKASRSGDFYKFNKENLLKLYEDIKHKSIEKISDEYDITYDKAEVLMPAMCIYISLIEHTKSGHVLAPNSFLIDAYIYEQLFPEEFGKINKEFNKNTIRSAQLAARKYNAIVSHSDCVTSFAKSIFEKMKKIHGLSGREKILLEVACILHDIGKFIGVKSHYRHSYYIVKNLEIVGLNSEEITIVACICLYHSRLVPSINDEVYRSLSPQNRVLVSKLAAILRLADALDRGHYQKFKDIDIKTDNDELVITIETDKNSDLESWSFKEKSVFFEDVFGIKAVLKKKRG